MPIKLTEAETQVVELLERLWLSGNRACQESDRPHIARFLSKKFAKITAEQPVEQQLKQIALALAVQVEKKTRQFVGPLHTDYRTLVFEVWQQSPQASEWCGDV